MRLYKANNNLRKVMFVNIKIGFFLYSRELVLLLI